MINILKDAKGRVLTSFSQSAVQSEQLYSPYGNQRYTAGTITTLLRAASARFTTHSPMNKRIFMESVQRTELYQVGQLLALYNMQPWWIRFCRVIRRVLLGIVIFVVFFLLVIVALFLYQYLIVFDGQVPDLQERLILSLPGFISDLLSCVGCMIVRNMFAQRVPASLLVCTEGLLEVRPKQIDVTRWDEIRGTLQGPGLAKRKSYKLHRIKRKPLLFGENFEDVEGLASLVRQQIQKG